MQRQCKQHLRSTMRCSDSWPEISLAEQRKGTAFSIFAPNPLLQTDAENARLSIALVGPERSLIDAILVEFRQREFGGWLALGLLLLEPPRRKEMGWTGVDSIDTHLQAHSTHTAG